MNYTNESYKWIIQMNHRNESYKWTNYLVWGSSANDFSVWFKLATCTLALPKQVHIMALFTVSAQDVKLIKQILTQTGVFI